MQRLRATTFVLAIVLGSLGVACAAPGPAGPIVLVPISGTVDDGMAHLVERSVARAEAEHASAIVLDVNTPGGLLAAAFDIRDALLGSTVPTVAYVSERAYSAGALISLATKTIVMAPGSSIGAAEPIPNDPKHVSAVRAEFASTAQRTGRNPIVAAAMVDRAVDVPGYKKSGAILTLTAQDARRAKIAAAIAPTLADALADAHVRSGAVERARYTFAERVERFATDPAVSGLLLSIGILGLLIEMYTLHGIAGIVGLGALALFFGTHVYGGFSDGTIVALAIVGVLGILLELHVFPGHGFAGIAGSVLLLVAIVLAFGAAFASSAVQAFAVAIVATVVVFAIARRFLPPNAFVRRFGFPSAQGSEYVTSRDFSDLVGHAGFATSLLRPAGVATIDGRRVDVLTEGDFVAAGSPVVVTRVEGARIFVHRSL